MPPKPSFFPLVELMDHSEDLVRVWLKMKRLIEEGQEELCGKYCRSNVWPSPALEPIGSWAVWYPPQRRGRARQGRERMTW